ncbi:30S ribosomal protein S8 [Candidatus Giovannonibacteria bacterium RIFCSPLOWO2_12_FULL_44_25]|uniref:Small ribosomal subunit protein uS8 n=3 Tax=Parcubacteria group TaxID=1794811 RepID=A0A837IGA3_9BACT|nr:MAG: 30S ribosomal protein S8 [Parcubacteria group bacterium GW2011_GWC1_44_10]KKT60169.1 MAG: 30S ribosomal protein S8 [Candidatus Giovannonibacteria bacterium GW2011_GWA1_44_25]KKU12376.1 MAG: 30S ribosomal protein S8 [Candidatus Azambacteria bacterium GW2011_GWC2_45_7b]KKU30016.1 MAG: 30S ribosomal protein S8 [Candidatus Giovannonibacteria bacterium GW2011_GWB1_46_20]OGF49373.1 MAG: 30S ribosomal protein S8 [Candidatus Giovannonibacteria bacterium GWA2_45_15]OGF59920.1 MAG: 30S ribosomal
MVTDQIADMLIRIKNAQASKKEAVSFPYSGIKLEIAKALGRAGYLGAAVLKGKKNGQSIEVKFLYDESGNPKISGVRRVSKLSRRTYRGWRDIYFSKNGFKAAVYSTPKGVMTDREARKGKVGGEILFEIW